MRLPLDRIYITTPFGVRGSVWKFGRHIGWDSRASVGTPVFAKAAGTVTERYVGTRGIKVLSIRYADYEHRYLHLSEINVSVGQKVKEGQVIAKSGATGGVAAHLHEDIRKKGTTWSASFSNYIDPEKHYADLLNKPKGDSEVANRTEVNNIYKAVLHRNGDKGGLDAYTGRNANTIVKEMLGSAEFKKQDAFMKSAQKQIEDLQKALKNEQNKPPEVVEKEVEKIVEKIVKVEVPVEVVKEVEKPLSWQRVLDWIKNQFKRR